MISHVWQWVRLARDLNRSPERSSIAPLKVVSQNLLWNAVAGWWCLHLWRNCHLHQHPNPRQSSYFREIGTRFEPFPERSSIAPLKVVSRNLFCGLFCYRVEAFPSWDQAMSSLRIAKCTRIPQLMWELYLNLSRNVPPSPPCR